MVMAMLSTDLTEFERCRDNNTALFTVYQLDSVVELRVGRDETKGDQIFVVLFSTTVHAK